MILRYVISVALAALVAVPASAQIPDDLVDVTIVPGWRDADGQHVAGLAIRMAPGWKTYWRAPGEGGIPPMFNWSGSVNIGTVAVHYPVPEVYSQNGLQSIGYEEAVLFPLVIDTEDASAPIQLAGDVEIGVCEEICIPVSFRVEALLPPHTDQSPTLNAALLDRPSTGNAITCEIEPIEDGLRVRVTTDLAPLAGNETAVVEASENGLWVSSASITRDGDRLSAVVEMVPPTAKPFALTRSDVRLTVLSAGQAVETLGCE